MFAVQFNGVVALLVANKSLNENHVLSVVAVARIALVKPEKARGVEDVLLRAAQMGQIVEKVRQHPYANTHPTRLHPPKKRNGNMCNYLINMY